MPGKDRILLCGGKTHQGKTRSCNAVEGTSACINAYRMSMGSRRHCRSSLDHIHDWCRINKRMLTEEIAMEGTFLDRIPLLILADDLYGK